MKTVLFSSLFVFWLCAPVMAAKTASAGIHLKNDTAVAVRAVVARGQLVFFDGILEPGDDKELVLQPGIAFDLRVSALPFQAVASRSYTATRGCSRIVITLTEDTQFQLSNQMSCTAEEPPPADPPPDESPPDASLPPQSLSRESLLAAFWSSGLVALALVGLLINRHE